MTNLTLTTGATLDLTLLLFESLMKSSAKKGFVIELLFLLGVEKCGLGAVWSDDSFPNEAANMDAKLSPGDA